MKNKVNSEEAASYIATFPDVSIEEVIVTGLSDAELLYKASGASVELCETALNEYGSLHGIADNTNMLAITLELSKRYLYEEIQRGDALCSPAQSRQYLQLQLGSYPHEVFACLFLDNHNRVIEFNKMFRGTIDGASVYPREVIKEALACNAAAVIFAHNHPSGVAEPSHADEQITRRLKEALALVDIRVLDHFVIGDEIVSFAERGLL